ncbi:MAG: hypothetical protein ACLQGP_38635 [Isosphaeraceae bacterium]
MSGWRGVVVLGVLCGSSLMHGGTAFASADLRLDKDFIAGIIEKLPAATFEQPGQLRGVVHAFRLLGIEARARQLVVACLIDGEFRAPVNGPLTDRIARSPQTPQGWRKFSFEIKARVNIEPGVDGAPRFRIGIDEVKRRELDGFSGFLAKVLGQFFDELITQIANGRASRLSDHLNAEIMRRVGLFKEYGVFCGIEYTPNEIALHFDLTRLRSEGIAGYVFAQPQPEAVPLYRWLHPVDRSHFYTIRPGAPDRPRSVQEGIACYVLDHQAPGAVPLYRWTSPRDHLYTLASDGEHTGRLGYRPKGISCYVYHDPRPGTVPLYRFFDPIRRQHFYTTHQFAEFLK